MDMSGEKRVPASRDTVWAALNDPEILKLAIPGCESVEKKSDTEFTARVSLADLDPPNGYTLSGTGSGGVAGFGKGEANVSLRDDGEGTIIVYQVHASVGGKLAQVGQRLIDSTAKKLADQFFTNLSAQLGGGKDEAAPAAAPASAPAPAATPACSQAITFWALAIAGLFALWIVNH
jgi:carbon monoxide dehydrogenase subunit G